MDSPGAHQHPFFFSKSLQRPRDYNSQASLQLDKAMWRYSVQWDAYTLVCHPLFSISHLHPSWWQHVLYGKDTRWSRAPQSEIDLRTAVKYTFTSFQFSKVQFSSVAQSRPTLCNPMNCSMPGLPVHHQLPEFTQTHVHRVGDAIQPSHPLLLPSPPAPNPSQHQGLFQWVSSSHEVAEVLEFQLQHQSLQLTPRTDLI